MTHRFVAVCLTLTCIFVAMDVCPTSVVNAQGSLEDYQRSRTIGRSLKRADITFHWMTDSTFWFWSPQGDDASLVLIYAAEATQTEWVTRKLLRLALAKESDRPAPPESRRRPDLRIDSVDAADHSFTVSFRDEQWNVKVNPDNDSPLSLSKLPPSDRDDAPSTRQATRPRRPRNGPPRRNRQQKSPDGQWTATIIGSNVQLESADGEQFRLSDDGRGRDAYRPRFYWSPDSKFLATIQETKPDRHTVTIVQSSPGDQLQPKLIEYDYFKPGDKIPVARVRIFDIESKKQIDIDDALFENAWSISRLSWSPDSSHFRFLFNQRGHQTMRYLSVDPSNGETTAIINEETESFFDYAGKLFLEKLDPTNELIWMSERDGWNHLYLFDSKTGTVKTQITKGDWVVREVKRVDHDQRQIWFTAGGIVPEHDPYFVHLCRVDFDGSNLTVLTQGNGTHTVTYSPEKTYVIDKFSRVDLAPVFELRRTSDGKKMLDLATLRWESVSTLSDSARPQPFVAPGRDGQTDIYGVIFRPSNFDPSKKYPILENIYAGPHSAFVPKGFSNRHGSQKMAELGFIVVQIDGMGTSQRSKAFHDVCWKNLGDSGFPDRIEWIKAAAAKFPEMDISKVGIYGGSAGGQSSLRGLLAHPDFYSVGTADCGCHDNRMDKIWWNELWMGWPLGPHYVEQSNVTQAHCLTGKLMLIVGELDRNVDPASTMQVVNALIKADKDFDLVVIPNAGHGATGTPYGRRRMQDFFVRNLLGVEPRWQPDVAETP